MKLVLTSQEIKIFMAEGINSFSQAWRKEIVGGVFECHSIYLMFLHPNYMPGMNNFHAIQFVDY